MAAFLENVKITKVANTTAAGTTDINSASVDMTGYESVCFVVAFDTITANAVTNIHVEQSADDSTFNDLTGSAITVADSDDNQVFASEIIRPGDRYVRCVVDRGTANAAVGTIYAFQYGARDKAVSNNVTDTITSEIHISPAEGTA